MISKLDQIPVDKGDRKCISTTSMTLCNDTNTLQPSLNPAANK